MVFVGTAPYRSESGAAQLLQKRAVSVFSESHRGHFLAIHSSYLAKQGYLFIENVSNSKC
jgi:hypothetical protein